MSGKGKFLILLFLAVALLSALGLYRLFALRFERGDIFPPYSSLRSDPLGCKALFLACGRLPGVEAARNFREPGKLKGSPGRTFFYLGSGEALLAPTANRQAEELENLARTGNRVVIALATTTGWPGASLAAEEAAEEDGETAADGEEDEEQQPTAAKTAGPDAGTSKGSRWGIVTGAFSSPAKPGQERPRATLTAAAPPLPPAIPLHSRRWLQADQGEWNTVYSHDQRAVVLERTIGTGSIVLMADSYLLSNEAMRSARLPGLLSWLLSGNRTVLFDEFHLGVTDNPGIMTLIRKHGLVPFLLALLALAALYVWQSAIPFVTPAAPEQVQGGMGQRDNFSGLVHLLRRNIAPGDLLATCCREWSRSFARESRQVPGLEEQITTIVKTEAARPAGKRDPLKRYREIVQILAGQRGKGQKTT